MTFTVTYRGAKGAPVTEAVEAADRADCLAQLKKRGIAPTSVKEGGAKQYKRAVGGKAKPTGGNSVAYVLLVACALLAVLGGIWLFGRGKEPPPQDSGVVRKRSALAKEVTPAKAAKPVPELEYEPEEDPKKVIRREVANLPREVREKLAFEEMQKEKIPLAPKTNRIFRTGIEASMARIFMTKLGDPPPPFFTTAVPLRDETHLVEILLADNPILETDTAAQRASKEMVALAKKEMTEYIKNGGNPEDFLKYYHGKLQEAFDLRRESAKSFMSVAREDPSVAGEYLERLNKDLAEKGIRQIELNEKQRKKFGLE